MPLASSDNAGNIKCFQITKVLKSQTDLNNGQHWRPAPSAEQYSRVWHNNQCKKTRIRQNIKATSYLKKQQLSLQTVTPKLC